jgi:hypothetical protein
MNNSIQRNITDSGSYLKALLNLDSAVEHGFVGNLSVPSKASFAVNGYSLNKNDNAAGGAEIFYKFL